MEDLSVYVVLVVKSAKQVVMSMLRVIAGVAKGTRLKSPAGNDVRPTTDRVREALFNILVRSVPGASFLDVCAGSGAVGIEALSRGAARAVFVERSNRNIQLIRSNLEVTRLADRAETFRGEAKVVLLELAEREQQFDVIFADPPYQSDLVVEITWLVADLDLLQEDGLFVLEHSSHRSIPEDIGLTLLSRRHYGDTTLSFYTSPRCKQLPGNPG